MKKKIAFIGKIPKKRKKNEVKDISWKSLENTILLNKIDQMCDYEISSREIVILIKSRIQTWRDKL